MATKKQKKAKAVLVAGGAGFVGSHLCDYLIARGSFVICFDNLSSGSKKNIAHLLKNPKFKFIKGDITNSGSVAGLAKFGKIEKIYHLASLASPPHYQKDPLGTWKANTLGTLNLLELARKEKAKFLFASTSEIYGDPLKHPQTEGYRGNVNPVGVRSCYDESKRAGETLCMDYYRKFGLGIKIVRIFNTYGPRMATNDGRVVSNFIVQALIGRPLAVYGKGNQTRSFQYVDDLITGLTKMMASPQTGPVNLGNPLEFTVLNLAKKVLKLTNSKSKIIYATLPEDDPRRRRPNISLAKKILNWSPKIALDQGLKKTIAYFQNRA